MKHLMMLCLFAVTGLMTACNYAAVESQNLVEKAIKQYETKNYKLATATFQNAIDRNPNNDTAYYYMALIDMNYKDFKPAAQKLNQAIGIEPESALYWYTLGMANAGQAEQLTDVNEADAMYYECVRAMNHAVQIDPHYAEASLQKARCHVGSRKYDDAAAAYEASIRSNPKLKSEQNTTVNFTELGQLYARFGFYNKAMSVLSNGFLINMDDAQLEAALADVLFEMQRYQEALTHYESALKHLDKQGDTKLHAVAAMWGAGLCSLEMAREAMKSNQQRKAFDHYNNAKKSLTDYVDNAHMDSEKIRKADAAAKIKDIEDILKDESI